MRLATHLVSTAASSGKSRLSWLAFGAAAIAALALTLGANLWLEHERIVGEATISAGKLAVALEAHTRSVFDNVDNVLRATQRELEDATDAGEPDLATARAILARNAERQRVIHSLSLRDRAGRVTLLSLLPESPLNDTSRSDYFTAQRDNAVRGSFVGKPLHSIVTGEWMIPVSRRLQDKRGEFAGVVVAAVPLQFFANFFQSLQVGEHGIVTLFRDDGVVLVREPSANRIGGQVPTNPLFRRSATQGPAGINRVHSQTDGFDRTFAYRTIADPPLAVSLGIALDDALAGWYVNLRVYLAFWLGCATLLVIFTVVMMRQAGRHDAAEALVHEAQDRFRNLVANVPGIVFQRVAKADGTLGYNYLSANAEKLFGHSVDELIRDPLLMINRMPADDRAAFDAALAESARTMTTFTIEYRIQAPSGFTRWLQAISTPRYLKSGDLVWDGLVIDITEQKHAELALQRSEAEAERAKALLTDAIESINGGFVLYDADDRLVLMNRTARDWHPEFAAAAVPGVAFEELVRRAAATGRVVAGGDDIETMVERRMAVHRKAFGQPIERCVDGRWYQITEYPTSDGGVVVLRTDITTLKEANLRLEEARLVADQANRAKSEFLAMMSHELRTPLNAILGFAEILRDHAPRFAHEKIVEYVSDIHASGTHLLTLINDVLDLSKAEAGKLELSCGAVDVTEIIGRSMRMVRERAHHQNLLMTADIAPGLPELWADERKLIQVLLNLLSNAVKFTPKSGRINISATHDDGALLISVSDTGVGIAPQDIEKVLSPFGQVDNLLTRQHTGTGLGLPLAKRLTELHGATLNIESTVGTGTTVTLRFPVSAVRAAAVA